MPLTKKGNKIMERMRSEYGSDKGKSMFYASRNAGRITGVDPESGPSKPGANKHAHRRLMHQRRAMEDHMRSQEDALMEQEPDLGDTSTEGESGGNDLPPMRKHGKRGKLDRNRNPNKDDY